MSFIRIDGFISHSPSAAPNILIFRERAQPAHAADRLPRRVLSILALVSHFLVE